MAGFKFHVFLSHTSADKPAVEELAIRLRKAGIEPWLDKWNLIPGQAWQPAIERALDECATCAVVIGSGGFGAWQNEEMRAAIARRVEEGQGQFRVIPVLLPGVDRPERGKLPAFLVATTWVEFRRSLDDAEALRRLVCGIRGEEPGAGPDAVAFDGSCPYRGLEVFDVEHAPFFFGREALSEWLLNELHPKATGQENRFLAMLGASGSGKSSLARAGLVAALKRGALDGSGDWPIVVFKPGRDPIESLSVGLAGLPGGACLIKDSRDLLNIKSFGDDSKSLHTFARLALRDAPRSRRLVVLVDQAEELFTLCKDESARKSLFDNLLHASTVADGQTIVLLTMRADFYGRCGPFPALAAAMSDHQLLVGPMTKDELRRAIVRPASLAGGEFEPGLVEMLLGDVAGQPGSLPLLQFALMELWERREGRRLTIPAYQAIGQLQGALKNRADQVLGQFDDAQRDLCRRIFLRLTQPGEGLEDTKRRASFGELVSSGADPDAVESVIRRLADARLITTEGNPRVPAEASVEVAHEALIRGWGRLREWIDADRAGLRLQRQLTEAAREWQAHRREGSFLYSGSRLAVALEWAKTRRDGLNLLEAEFLAVSLRRRRRGIFARTASILVLLALPISAWEWFRWHERVRQEQSRAAQKIEFDKLTKLTNEAVADARQLSLEGHWLEAIKELQVAQSRLEPGPGYDVLRHQVASAIQSYQKRQAEREAQQRDEKLVTDLEDSHLLSDTSGNEGRFDPKATINGYRRAFREGGIDIDTLSPEAVAELIRAKPPIIRQSLAAALDDWAWKAGPPEDSFYRIIARDADPDPWRSAIREANWKKDTRNLRNRAHDPDVARQGALTLNHLGAALAASGIDEQAASLLRQAQQLHPHDFFINYNLALILDRIVPPQHDEAIRFYSIAVSLRPRSHRASCALANTLYRVDRIDEALQYYERAIELNPSFAWGYNGRGNARVAKKDVEEAIADYDRAIELHPKWASPYSGRGNAYRIRKAYDKAIADLNKAIELDPKFAMAYSNRGIAWSEEHETTKAIADFERAIKLSPKSGAAYVERGIAWVREKAYDKAIADYTEAIRLDPRIGQFYALRGNALRGKRSFDQAIADYDKAIELSPKRSSHYLERAVAWDFKKAYDKAIADFDQGIRLDPKNSTAHSLRGTTFRHMKAYDKAIADYDLAIQIDPKKAAAYRLRGFAWLGKANYDKAIADYNEAIGLDPKSALGYIDRGIAWSRMRNYGKAIVDYQTAIQLDPKSSSAHNLLAWNWATCPDLKHRDGKKAVESATRACELTDWKSAVNLDTLAAACAEIAEYEQAIKWQEKALALTANSAANRKPFAARLDLYRAKQPYHEEQVRHDADASTEPAP